MSDQRRVKAAPRARTASPLAPHHPKDLEEVCRARPTRWGLEVVEPNLETEACHSSTFSSPTAHLSKLLFASNFALE